MVHKRPRNRIFFSKRGRLLFCYHAKVCLSTMKGLIDLARVKKFDINLSESHKN